MLLKKSSRRHYRDGAAGHLVADERGRWSMLDERGRLVPLFRRKVDQAWATRTVAAEEAQQGRTSYFPGELVESRTLTLPADLWRKVRKPYSLRLAEILRDLRVP